MCSLLDPEFIVIIIIYPPHPAHPVHHPLFIIILLLIIMSMMRRERRIKGRVDCAGASATNADGSVLLLLPSLIHFVLLHVYVYTYTFTQSFYTLASILPALLHFCTIIFFYPLCPFPKLA